MKVAFEVERLDSMLLRDSQRQIDHWRRVAKRTRIVGIGFIIAGAMNAIYGIRAILDPSLPFAVNGVPDDSLMPRVIGVVFCSIGAIVGVAMVSMRAYRPDLGDRSVLAKMIEPFGERQTQPYRGARAWWTGDPKSN